MIKYEHGYRRRRLHRRQFHSGLPGAGNGPVINLDKLVYAGNLQNLAALEGDARQKFLQGDIGDGVLVGRLLAKHRPRSVVNFAAESNADPSVGIGVPLKCESPKLVTTDAAGTLLAVSETYK